MTNKIKVTVWNEYRHERNEGTAKDLYPEGIHNFIKDFLKADEELEIKTSFLDLPECGLSDELLDDTDVLIYWAHRAHSEVADEAVKRIQTRVYTGKMGLIMLHSAHESKVMKAVVGTTGTLSWGRNQKEIVWNMMPGHPIAKGIGEHFELFDELYAEPFNVPQPDALVFGSWYEDGYIFRSGLCYTRGQGRVFYFQPGHETCRSFYNENVKRIIANAVHWAAPTDMAVNFDTKCPHLTQDPKEKFHFPE